MKVERKDLLDELGTLKRGGLSYLVKITAVDYKDRISIVYTVRDPASGKDEVVEVDVAPTDAWVPSAAGIYRAADWYERELAEMFGDSDEAFPDEVALERDLAAEKSAQKQGCYCRGDLLKMHAYKDAIRRTADWARRRTGEGKTA